MARNAKTTSPETNAPDFIAWHVVQKGKKSFWNKIGASWHHKDGKGQTLQLEVVPINGRIVLREPLENPQAEKESAA